MKISFIFSGVIFILALLSINSSVQSSTQAAELEEVIVTANRREQSLQEVAISVAAFTDEFFKRSGTTSLN